MPRYIGEVYSAEKIMSSNLGEIFSGGATTSQHVDADDDDHFQNTTFALKRTRSLGLLDEFIDSEQQQKMIEKQNEERENEKQASPDGGRVSKESSESNSSQDFAVSSDLQDEHPSPAPTASSAFIKSPDIVPHDDSHLVAEPSRHVDYLSHQWDVSDISKSWRYVILRRKNVANAARLENASWRTWAQRRSNLKTISPEKVNWSKESDVTWLYGPIVDDDDHDQDNAAAPEDSRSFSTASSVVAGDISIARKTHGPKPILKKRTMEDIMISHLNLLKLEIATARAEQEQTRREDAAAQARRDAIEKSGSEKPPEYFDYDAISAKLNSQYRNISAASSTNSSSLDLVGVQKPQKNDPDESSIPNSAAGESHSPSGSPSAIIHSSLHKQGSPRLSVKEKRHIHFNDEVQQCIAINDSDLENDEYDEYDDDENDYDYEEGDDYLYESYNADSQAPLHYEADDVDNDDDEDEDDEEGGFFLNVRSPSSAQMAGPLPGLSSQANNTQLAKLGDGIQRTPSKSSFKDFRTIHSLPPTTLNYGSYDEDSDDSNPYTSSISHNVDSSSSRGYDYYYDYNTVYQVDANHAIYGDANKTKPPDVVDVPENITVGSNFDYEIIENDNSDGKSQISPETMGSIVQHSGSTDIEKKEKLPISSLNDSVGKKEVQRPLSLEESDSDDSSGSESGEVLSISARNSSQSLAQLVFGHTLTSVHLKDLHYPQHIVEEPEPDAKHISSINPNYSSTALSKQPHSSNSLSDQFFGNHMTKAETDESLGRSFFDTESENSGLQTPLTKAVISGTQSPPVLKKTSALPPHTTSACAFLGGKRSTAPIQKSFIFESESDSDDQIEDPLTTSKDDCDKNRTSYLSLYEVAGRNGITLSTTEGNENQHAKKGLAVTNFLGSWNKGNLS